MPYGYNKGDLPITPTNLAQAKQLDREQKNEHLRINKYSEGVCFGCHRKDLVRPALLYACEKCINKRGLETLLAKVGLRNMQGFCLLHARTAWNVWQINVRLCPKCTQLVADADKYLKENGGELGVNPFWKYVKQKHGHDWAILFARGDENIRR